MAELKGCTTTDDKQFHEQREHWLQRSAALGYVPALSELADVVNDQAWDTTRRFSFGGVALEGFVKTGVLRSVTYDRRSTVVGNGGTVRTVHRDVPVYELDCGEPVVQRVYPILHGQPGAAPGTKFRMLVIGKAGTRTGTCVSLTDGRGTRYSLAEVDELAKDVGVWVPKAGPAAFWFFVSFALAVFSWEVFPPTMFFALLGLGLSGWFLKRNFSLTNTLWRQVRRLEEFWRGRPI